MTRALTAGELALVETLQKTGGRRIKTLLRLATRVRITKHVHISRTAKRRIEEMLTLGRCAVVKVGKRGLRIYSMNGHLAQVKAGQIRGAQLHNGGLSAAK